MRSSLPVVLSAWKTRVFVILLVALLFSPGMARAQASDDDLQRQVLGAIRGYANFTIFDDVSVAVSDRAVTLTGRVTMPFKRNDIGARVSKIDGVRDLVNDIQVLPVSIEDSRLRSAWRRRSTATRRSGTTPRWSTRRSTSSSSAAASR